MKILRGRVLSFKDAPASHEDTSCYVYHEDGCVVVVDDTIIGMGDYAGLAKQFDDGEIIDHRPHLILPGLIDTHMHFPQMQVIASFGTKLLEWLNRYTFVEEQKFGDRDHCVRIANQLFDTFLRHGTTTAVAYCSVHKTSADVFFEEAEQRNLRMIAGKVMMDRNAPEGLLDTPQSGYDDSKALIETWHGRGRASYAISPRFAITSTPEQLEATQSLLKEHPDCYLQTHLSENDAEIELTKQLYPKAHDYLDVYEHYELLGHKSLFGHAIHLSEREKAAMAESGSVAVFCPTSNLFLGSGLYDFDGLRANGVRTAVATDTGGGTSYSMLRTLDEAYKVLQLRNQVLNPLHSFYWMTLGNARALSLEDKIGTLDVGTEADIVVLNARSRPEMALRMETVETLSEELFLLQTLGDDRAAVETYVAGEASSRNSLFLKST